MPVANEPQAGGFFRKGNSLVLGAAQSHAYHYRRAGEAPAGKLSHVVQQEPLDPVGTVGGKQHTVVGAEEAAFVHRDYVDPIPVRFERVVDVGREHPQIVARVFAGQRMDPVGSELDILGNVGHRPSQRAFQGHEAAVDAGLVAQFHVVTG